MTLTDPHQCRVCGITQRDHPLAEAEGRVNHPFGILKSLRDPKDAPKTSIKRGVSGDPVLRMLLVRKGIISPEEILQLETELRATGVIEHDNGTAEDVQPRNSG